MTKFEISETGPSTVGIADHHSNSDQKAGAADINTSLEFKLLIRNKEETQLALNYWPHTSDLRWADTGERVSLKAVGLNYDISPARKWPVAKAVSPENPGRKRFPIRALKIQMGLKCNQKCSYCNQTARPEDSHGNPDAARRFLDDLPRWFTPPPAGDEFRIEFWGGEPFAYWKTMQLLGDVLKERFPQVLFSVVTNGTILDDEKIEWLARHEVLVSISHDGPGQKENRGDDPFDNPQTAAAIQKLYSKLQPKGLINFNCVLATNSVSLKGVRNYIAERLGCPASELPLTTEEFVLPYEDAGMRLSLRSEADSEELRNTLIEEISEGAALNVFNVRDKLQDFFVALSKGRPSYALTQRCGMDREDTIAVDLNGNVLTCQNTAASDGQRIGTLLDFDAIRLDTGWHWLARQNCKSCPVIQLCKGCCIRLHGDQWEQACKNSYTYNFALLRSAVGLLVQNETRSQ